MRGKIFFFDDFVSSDGGNSAPHWWLFRLYDFPVGGSTLQPGHRQALDDVIVPFIQKYIGGGNGNSHRKLQIRGYASHTGRDVRNSALARERARTVARHVWAALKAAGQGEEPQGVPAAHYVDGEDAYARATDIIVQPMSNALLYGTINIPDGWFTFQYGGRRYNPATDWDEAQPLVYWDHWE